MLDSRQVCMGEESLSKGEYSAETITNLGLNILQHTTGINNWFVIEIKIDSILFFVPEIIFFLFAGLIYHFIISRQQRLHDYFFWQFAELKCSCPFFTPFIWNRIDVQEDVFYKIFVVLRVSGKY